MKKLMFVLPVFALAFTGKAFAQDSFSGASFGTPTDRIQYAPVPSNISKGKQAIKISTGVAGADVTTGPTYIYHSAGKGFRIFANPKKNAFVKVMEKGAQVRISLPAATAAEAEKAPVGKPMKKGQNLGMRPAKK